MTESKYFHTSMLFVDPSSFYKNLKNATGYEIITNAYLDDGYPIPEGLTSVGLLPAPEYERQLVRLPGMLINY
jgi:alpha-1,3(6)-mannosylglycoprotein beta-1,6-N-acetyl-glucosaminyltransferase